MLFNFGKYKGLQSGYAQYTMGVLNTTVEEKDIGLTTSADMKLSG